MRYDWMRYDLIQTETIVVETFFTVDKTSWRYCNYQGFYIYTDMMSVWQEYEVRQDPATIEEFLEKYGVLDATPLPHIAGLSFCYVGQQLLRLNESLKVLSKQEQEYGFDRGCDLAYEPQYD